MCELKDARASRSFVSTLTLDTGAAICPVVEERRAESLTAQEPAGGWQNTHARDTGEEPGRPR